PPTPPPDVTIVGERVPSAPSPLPTHAPSPVAMSSAPPPVLLPETKLPSEPRVEVPSRDDRKINYDALIAERAKAFPPAAHSVPTRIVLPTINVDSKVVQVGWQTVEQNGQLFSEWEVADFAVGFHENSALPGAVGNTVMTGHNNIKGEIFKNLIMVKVGDEIFVYADDKPYRYIVAQKLLLAERDAPLAQRLQNAQWIAPTDDVRLTLVSCWPYTSNTHRVIVVARPAS
ncbi:MAG: sortase, partial [Chloroflexota bacterium]